MTTDTTPRELSLTRTFAAPRQLVWDAYTVPEQLAAWWGPAIMHTPVESITVDLRPGGAFRLTMVSDLDGAEYPSEMTFVHVDPIDRLVYGWEPQARGLAGGQVSVSFSEQDGRTTIVQHFTGDISDEMFPMMEQGTNEQLDKLAELVERAS